MSLQAHHKTMAIFSASSVIVISMLIVPGWGQTVTRTIPAKLFRHEEVCDDEYGTVLGQHFMLQHPDQCGAKCATDPACNSAIYNFLVNGCTKNTDFFENRTNIGCTRLVSYLYVSSEMSHNATDTMAVGCPVPLNTTNVEYPTMLSGLNPVGTNVSYTCHPCTYFPPLGSSATVTCQQDGTWSDAICLFGPDEGHIANGAPIPLNAIGCNANITQTCSDKMGNFTFDGISETSCYCDQACCGAGDCCFDAMCEDAYMTEKNITADCPNPLNTTNVEYPTMLPGLNPVGTNVSYTCHPCTYFPPLGSSATVTCQQNGTWSDAICLFGPDVGYVFNGSPIPLNAIGCNANITQPCNYKTGNFTFDGMADTVCYCDDTCCGTGDCCFDAMCGVANMTII